MRYTDPAAFRKGATRDVRDQVRARQYRAVRRIIQEAVGGGAISGMVRFTPKDTGWARKSYQVLSGSAAAKLPPPGRYRGDVEAISAKLSARAASLKRVKRLRAVMSVPHSIYIEHGSPSQGTPIAAPMRRTVDALRPRIPGIINDL